MGYLKAGKKGGSVGFNKSFQEAKEKVQDVEKYPVLPNLERGITKETCEAFGVRAGLSEKDGKTIEAWYFPSYNQQGKLVGYMKQDLTKDKYEDGHWSAVGSVKITNKLLGQDLAETNARKKTRLLVTEGGWDCLSTWQAMCFSVKDTQYKELKPFVTSIPLGTSNAKEAIMANESFVKGFSELSLFFDNDYANPVERKKGIVKGLEARQEVAGAFVGSGLKITSVLTNGAFKDASDMLQYGVEKNCLDRMQKELGDLAAFKAVDFAPEAIKKASDISFDELIAPGPVGVMVEQFPKLMDKIKGLRTGELITVTAPSGAGKSTGTSVMASALEAAGETVSMIYLEETNKETLQRLVARRLGINFQKFKHSPLNCGFTSDQVKAVYDTIVAEDSTRFLDHFGSLEIEKLMEHVRYLHFVEGSRYIILDHLSMVVSGSRVQDERKELDIAMTELAAFCAANDCGIIVVVHLNRSGASDFRPPKGKNGEEVESWWVPVTKESMRGSAALEQLSFIVLGLEPEIRKDRQRGRVRWVVLKNRPWSYLGEADTFQLDDDTGEVQLCNTDLDF